MNLTTINTKDAQDLKAKMMNANINEVKTMLVENYGKKGQAALTRYAIALRVLKARGIKVVGGVNNFSFETI
jgi:hypothetical protein